MLTGPGGAHFGWSVWTGCEASDLGFMHCCCSGGGLTGARRGPTRGGGRVEPAQCTLLWFTGQPSLVRQTPLLLLSSASAYALTQSNTTAQSYCWAYCWANSSVCTLANNNNKSCQTAVLKVAVPTAAAVWK